MRSGSSYRVVITSVEDVSHVSRVFTMAAAVIDRDTWRSEDKLKESGDNHGSICERIIPRRRRVFQKNKSFH